MIKNIIYKCSILGMIIVFISSCELDKTDDIYPVSSALTPVITGIQPDSAFGGIMEITIVGENFSTSASESFIYFGTSEAKVLSSTENEIILRRPVDIGGEYMVKAVMQNAFTPSEFGPYKVEEGINILKEEESYNSIAVGNDDTLYAEKDNKVFRISANGASSEYGTIDFVSSASRMGPGGFLYIQKRENRNLYRIAPGGGEAVRFTRVKRNASVFDFDEEGYIYSGGDSKGFSVTTPDGSGSIEYEIYDGNFAIKAMRVYDGFVYLAADTLLDEDEEGFFRAIYRHQLLGSGVMGDQELFFDWKNSEGHSKSAINDLAFSEDGKLFVATDNDNPVLVIYPDGSSAPLYEGNLNSPAVQLTWGVGNYLYMNRLGNTDLNSSLVRIVMGEKTAPYYGRN